MRSRRRDEQGGILVLTAVVMAVLVTFAAFAVDLGMQRVVRRDMQTLADAVALDLARELDGRSQTALATVVASSATSALSQSVKRNSTSFGWDGVTATADWGAWDGTTWNTAAEPPTAVKVTTAGATDFVFTSGSGGAGATAYALASSTACFKLGSYVAAVRSGDSAVISLLNDVLDLNLDVLSYQGIANADLRLAQLAADPRIGSETRLLTTGVAFDDLVRASIDALGKESTNNTVAINALTSVLNASARTATVRLDRIFAMTAGDAAALSTNVSVLDILTGAVLVADGGHAVSIPNVQAGVPGVGAQFSGDLRIQQGAQTRCGRVGTGPSASTSQLAGTVGFDLENMPSVNINDGILKGTLQTGRGTGSLVVSLGNATGTLSTSPAVTCGKDGAPTTFSVDVTSGLTSYTMTTNVAVSGKAKLALLGLAAVDAEIEVVVRLTMTSTAPSATTVTKAPLSLPPNDVTPYQVGNAVGPLVSVTPSIVSTKVDALGLLSLSAGQLLAVGDSVVASLTTGNGNFVDKSLKPLAVNVDSKVVTPVTKLLGIRLGGADVYALAAACGVPYLGG